jgi:hypothetical protein
MALLKAEIKVFWVVTLYNVVVGHQHFKGPYCLHHLVISVSVTGRKESLKESEVR